METAETGDDSAIISMNKLEKAFPELVIKESGDGEKVIEKRLRAFQKRNIMF